MGLVAIVGFAAIGGQAAPAERQAVATAIPSPSARVAQRQVALDLPARRGEVVTTRELIVRGRVAIAAGEVRIMLESSNGKPIATAAVDPTGFGHDGWVPFESRFRLTTPRPGGEMVLFIVAVDGDGVPIDAIRRRFTVGAIVEIPVPAGRTSGGSGERPTHGEDGLMGGLPFGTNMLHLDASGQ